MFLPGLALAALLAPTLVAQPAYAGSSVVLRSVTLTSDGETSTLSLHLSGPTREHLSRLHAPERLIIDLAHTRRQATMPKLADHGVIRRVRAGVHAGSLRLVLSLAAPVRYRFERRSAGGALTLRIRLSALTASHVASAEVHATAHAGAGASPGLDGHTPVHLSSPGAHAPTVVQAKHAPPPGEREVIVAVDAGHGGVDPGATGPDGVHEKDVTLAIARDLAARIDRTPGMRAYLTRSGDYFVALRERMRLAHQAHADLFVSIHADSAPDHEVTGASVYTLSERGASSEAARRLADEQNAADLAGGISLAAQAPSLRSVLLDLSQGATMGESGEAAQDVLAALDRVGQIRKHEVQHAAFVVLKSPDVPSMLIETAYISNRRDERRLARPAEQRQLAAAILRGIEHYFREFPPQGSLFARAHAVASAAS